MPAKAARAADRVEATANIPTEPARPTAEAATGTAGPAKRAPRKASPPKTAAPIIQPPNTASPSTAGPSTASPNTASPNTASPDATDAAAETPAALSEQATSAAGTEGDQAATPSATGEPAHAPAEPISSAAEVAQPSPAEEPASHAVPAETATPDNQQSDKSDSDEGAAIAPSAEEGPAAAAQPEHSHTEAWAKLVADPGHAPELLALAAVQSVGPRAREWAARSRVAYPTADEAALARLATRQFTRAGSLGSVVGAVAGSYAPIVLLGTAAVAHAELILHLAASYGLDPTHPDRAADLLVLTRVHADRGDAEAALAAARRPRYDDGGLSGAVWRLGRMIATQASEWGLIRLADRFFPGVSLLAAFLTSRAAAESTAARANAYYAAIGSAGAERHA